jgi:alpha-beta hydrolase superfamily lysophospholipase
MLKFFAGFSVIFLVLLFGAGAVLYWPEKAYQPFQVSDAYQKQADSFTVLPMPADWVWSSFVAEDKTKLRWGQTGNSGTADVTLLIIPGYTATLEMYGEHIDLLAERGFHVVGIDLRGQGGSERYFKEQPEKLWVEDFSIYSNDLALFIQSQDYGPERTVIPVAISFGGHVALRLGAEHSGMIDGLVLLAPAIEPKAGKYEFDQALKLMNGMRKMGLSKRYVLGGSDWKPVGQDYSVAGIEWCSSEAKRLFLRDAIFTNNPELRVGDATNQWGAEFFESSQYIRQSGILEIIEIPVLMFSADQDDFVSTATNEVVCEEALANCKNIGYPGTGHCLTQETDNVVFDILTKIESFALEL